MLWGKAVSPTADQSMRSFYSTKHCLVRGDVIHSHLEVPNNHKKIVHFASSQIPDLGSNANDTYTVSVMISHALVTGTYRRQDGRQRCQSWWTPRCHPCRGRRCQSGRRGCAIAS